MSGDVTGDGSWLGRSRRAMVTFVSRDQERLVQHLLESWHQRKVATVRQQIVPDLVTDCDPGLVAHIETGAWRALEDTIRTTTACSPIFLSTMSPGWSLPRGISGRLPAP